MGCMRWEARSLGMGVYATRVQGGRMGLCVDGWVNICMRDGGWREGVQQTGVCVGIHRKHHAGSSECVGANLGQSAEAVCVSGWAGGGCM